MSYIRGCSPDWRKDALTYQALAGVEELMGSSIPLSVLRRFEAIGAGPWLMKRLYEDRVPDEVLIMHAYI